MPSVLQIACGAMSVSASRFAAWSTASGRSPNASASRSAMQPTDRAGAPCNSATDSARMNVATGNGLAVPRQSGFRDVITT